MGRDPRSDIREGDRSHPRCPRRRWSRTTGAHPRRGRVRHSGGACPADSSAPGGGVNMLRLLWTLLGAVVRSIRSPECADQSPAPDAPAPRVPRQARRHVGDQAADLLARAYPHWNLTTIPTASGPLIVAAYGAHLSEKPASRPRTAAFTRSKPRPPSTRCGPTSTGDPQCQLADPSSPRTAPQKQRAPLTSSARPWWCPCARTPRATLWPACKPSSWLL